MKTTNYKWILLTASESFLQVWPQLQLANLPALQSSQSQQLLQSNNQTNHVQSSQSFGSSSPALATSPFNSLDASQSNFKCTPEFLKAIQSFTLNDLPPTSSGRSTRSATRSILKPSGKSTSSSARAAAGVASYKCKFCDRRYQSETYIRKHILRHHKEKVAELAREKLLAIEPSAVRNPVPVLPSQKQKPKINSPPKTNVRVYPQIRPKLNAAAKIPINSLNRQKLK